MPKLDYAQVLAYARWLEDDSDGAHMRTQDAQRLLTRDMLLPPTLSDALTRGGEGVFFPSPYLINIDREIRANVRAYQRHTTIVPLGAKNADLREKGDSLENWLAVALGRMDDGKRVSDMTLTNNLNLSYSVMQARSTWGQETGDEDDFFFHVDTPDPQTCYFQIPNGAGPFSPRLFARHYWMLVEDAEKLYSGHPRALHPGAGKTLRQDGAGVLSFGEPLSDDRPSGNSRPPNAGPGGAYEELEIYELHDTEYSHIIALNRGQSGPNATGELLSCVKHHMTGGPAVVIPSNPGPGREAYRRWNPALLPLLQAVWNINWIRTIRATKIEMSKPDIIVGESEEDTTARSTAGQLATAARQMESTGLPSIVYVGGRPLPWVDMTADDMDKVEQSSWTELREYANSWKEITPPDTLTQVNTNPYLADMEARRKQMTPLLSGIDWAWREMAKKMLSCVAAYDDKFPVYALGGERASKGKEVEVGSEFTLTASDLAAFRYHIVITTQSMTDAELRLRIQDWAYRKSIGISTTPEGIEAAGYTDVMAQIKELAVEDGKEAVSPFVFQQLLASVDEEYADFDGIQLGLLQNYLAGQQAAQGGGGAGVGVGAGPMRAPEVGRSGGGSGGVAA